MEHKGLTLALARVLLLLLFCSAQFSVKAQNEEWEYKTYRYTYADGLSDNLIHDLSMDAEGYLWIATEKGLSRFDGYNFVNFDSTTTPGFFVNPKVQTMTRKGDILYLTSPSDGVIAFDTRHFTCSQIHTQGTFNFACSGDTLLFFHANGSLELEVAGKIVAKRQFGWQPRCSALFRNGRILASIENHPLMELSAQDLHTIRVFDANLINIFCQLRSDSIRNVLFLTQKGLIQLDPNNNLSPIIKKADAYNITSFALSSSGGFNYIVAHHSFNLLRDGIKNYLPELEDGNAELRCVIAVDERTTFVGTNQGLACIIKSENNAAYLDDTPAYSVQSIRVRRKIIPYENDLYLLGFPGLFKYSFESRTFRNIENLGFSSYDGLVAKNHLFYLLEGGGLHKLDFQTNTSTNVHTMDLTPKDELYGIGIMPDSLLLIGGKKKIVLFDPVKSTSSAISLQPDEIAISIAINKPTGAFFYGTNKGLYRLKKEAYLQHHGLESELLITDVWVRDILIDDAQHTLWIATETGLLKLVFDARYDRIISKVDLSSKVQQKTTALLDDGRGWIWASTFRGLRCINKTSMEVLTVDKRQGLKNEEYNYKSAVNLPDGKLMFGGLNGYDIVNPSILDSKNENRALQIAGYRKTSNDQSVFIPALSDTIEFKTNIEDINIYLSALNFGAKDDYTFQYQLDGRAWVSLGSGSIVRLSNLVYGVHHLRIRMEGDFGQLLDQRSLVLYASIPFYKTGEFMLIVLLFILLLLASSLYFYSRAQRVERMTKEQIAMDLHDETGTILTRLLMLNKSLKSDDLGRMKINEGLNEVLFSMRAFLVSLRSKKFTLAELGDDLQDFLSLHLQGTNIQSELKQDSSKDIELNGSLYRDIKLCVYEAVNNAIKYSGGDRVIVEIRLSEQKLKVVVEDNGKFNSIALTLTAGNGLRNMEKRTLRNGGNVFFKTSTFGSGLRNEMTFKIS